MHPHKSAVLCHGEKYHREDTTLPSLTGSIKESTHATFSLAGRANLFEGLIETGTHVGEYLTRDIDGKISMVTTVLPQQRSLGLDFVYLTQCNRIVTLARPRRYATGDGDGDNDFEVYAEKVFAFVDVTLRRYKEQTDGLLPNQITVIHLPKRFEVQRMDKVYFLEKKHYAMKPEDIDYSKILGYRLDSINSSLYYPIDTQTTGVDIMQVLDDVRTGATDEGDTNSPAPGGEDEWWD